MMWLFLIAALTGVDASSVWNDANQAYRDGRYEDAVAGYESLLEQGAHNGKLHFNLGNAYFKTGELGLAVLHYYRAQRFMPGDPDVRQNLRIAADARVDPVIEGEHEGMEQRLQTWMWRLPYSTVFWMAIALLVIAALAGLALSARLTRHKAAGYVLVCAGLAGVLLSGLAYFQYDALTERNDAVVLRESVDVLSGPSDRESVTFTIHEGIRVHILDRTDGWYRIRLANGFNGWLRRNTVEII